MYGCLTTAHPLVGCYQTLNKYSGTSRNGTLLCLSLQLTIQHYWGFGMGKRVYRGDYALLVEEGGAGTRPSSSCNSCATRPLFWLISIFLIISFTSSIIFVWTFDRPTTVLRELVNVFLDEDWLGGGWRFIDINRSALETSAPYKARSTLAETFFTPACAEAWIADGILCDELAMGVISQETIDEMRLSIVHTWVNGTDSRLHEWKEAVFRGQPITSSPHRVEKPGDAARHFRCVVCFLEN